MPLRKRRSVEEMAAPPWRQPLDPQNLRLACDLRRSRHASDPADSRQVSTSTG